MPINIEDIELGIEFVSAGIFDSEAFINIETGELHLAGDDVDEEVPGDLYENAKYLSIPHKSEFNLGKPLAIAFTAQNIPEKLDSVYAFFSRKGAYSRFKALLASQNQLDNWYEYEQAALRHAALEWCRENSLDVDKSPAKD